MSKKTLLQLTQSILSEMDSDEVTSISDTIESQQVATLIQSVYFEMMDRRNWRHLSTLFQLETAGDTSQPTHMTLPTTVKELEWLTYNVRRSTDTRDKFEPMRYLYPDDFIVQTNGNNSADATVQTVVDDSGVRLFIRNDRPPQFWTSFDDDTLVFDAFDSGVDTTLLTVKTQCQGWENPVWTETDAFVPDLPDEAFSALEAEAKSTAFTNLKQQSSPKAEQQSQRQERWLSRKGWRASGGVRYPNYGRKPQTSAATPRNPLFDKN